MSDAQNSSALRMDVERMPRLYNLDPEVARRKFLAELRRPRVQGLVKANALLFLQRTLK